jgi:hypothetical protein
VIKNYETIRALVDVRTQITALDRALSHAITALMPAEKEEAPTALDLGDGLPPQCASGVCNDD